MILGAFLLLVGIPEGFCQDTAKLEETLDAAVRNLYKGMRSTDEAEQLAALRAIFPSRKDIDALFPNHSGKVGPLMEDMAKDYEKNLPKVAKEFQKGGAITKVEGTDVRKSSDADEYKEVFKMMADDIPVYKTIVRKETGTSGGAVYVYVNSRWVLFRGLSALPRVLEKVK